MQFSNYASLPLELAENVANIHERIPLSWDPLRTISSEKVFLTQKKLGSINIAQTIVVAVDAHQELLGFHWVTIRNEKALILSTWVDESKRQLGIGKSLKQLGEAWVLKQNMNVIISKVHQNNLKMKAFNDRSGYVVVGEEKEYQIFQKNLVI